MATTVRFEDTVEIPLEIGSLADFRRWAFSDEFPETGRIDYIAGCIEVHMSPEEFYCHGVVKTEIAATLHRRVQQEAMGYLVTDQTRVSSVPADLSAEPDIVFVSEQALDSGRVRLIPKVAGGEDRYVELEGAPELIVEIVSDSSVSKDTRRLPAAYFRAGVDEYWLVDARCDPLVFCIHHRGPEGFQPASVDAAGWQFSQLFRRSYRLERGRNAKGRPYFVLHERPQA